MQDMAIKKKPRRRLKKSGVVYFAVNNRNQEIVKIGMTTDTAESRLIVANRKHEFMCGTWTISQKVATNDVKRTEELAHTIFSMYKDDESVSSEMYYIPEGMTVKKMADHVREKDKIMQDQILKKEKALEQIKEAQLELDKLNEETIEMISLKED